MERHLFMLNLSINSSSYEPRHEKTGFMHICENKEADQVHGNREADQRHHFHYTDSTIPLLS